MNSIYVGTLGKDVASSLGFKVFSASALEKRRATIVLKLHRQEPLTHLKDEKEGAKP